MQAYCASGLFLEVFSGESFHMGWSLKQISTEWKLPPQTKTDLFLTNFKKQGNWLERTTLTFLLKHQSHLSNRLKVPSYYTAIQFKMYLILCNTTMQLHCNFCAGGCRAATQRNCGVVWMDCNCPFQQVSMIVQSSDPNPHGSHKFNDI